MPLSQHKTELALQWHRKHYNTEYIALTVLLITTGTIALLKLLITYILA